MTTYNTYQEAKKEITVENFGRSNVKKWIDIYSHKQKVEFAIYCAELVIDLYTGSGNAPKKAIQAAKDWLLSPSEDNSKKCKDAADAAYAAYAADAVADAVAAADSADAAYYAAYAAADAAYYAYYAAYYAAYAADAADYAADAAYYAAYAADAADKKTVKEKIVNWIIGKYEQPKPKHIKEEYVKVEYSNVWEIIKLYEEGVELFKTDSNEHQIERINSIALRAQSRYPIYRKVVTELTEREAFVDTARAEAYTRAISDNDFYMIINALFDSGKFKLVEGE